ncbi:MAG TPA: zinc ribbon domain-containing protein [Thermoanaerobaculia bacterium]|nr:zinc ribbon domain-containing protein [Thermoanaerobaculia bacterium]HQR65929.1 zinc ribbon domain-containing protein [Thermoanaerobaculia bacterium]
MTDVPALRCPSCGAPVTEADRSCGHCLSLLATRRCADCFTLNPRDAEKCSRCGADLPSESLSVSAAGKLCPECRVPLVGRKTGVLGYAECARCGGLFLSNEVFDRVVEGADARATTRALDGEAPPGPEKLPKRFHYRKCPFCPGLMTRRNYGAGSGVILDLCGKHGVFLDRGELTAIVDFLENGGRDRTMRREREKLREEVSALESRKRAVSSPAGVPGRITEVGALADLLRWLGSVLPDRLR